jgi:hypothetical protein
VSTATEPAPAAPAVRARAVDPYWIAGTVLVALSVAFALRHPLSGDMGMHVATVERLRENLTRPGNPLVEADAPSAYYSPYTVLLALAARAFGLSAQTVLAAAGPVNIALLVVGVRGFVRTLSTHRYAPLLALSFLLLLWGPHPRVWSGFFGLWAMPLTQAFPGTLALALTLLFWAGLVHSLDRPAWPRFLGLGLLAAVIALTHQFTFVTAALGALALVVSRFRALSRAAWLGLALAGAVWLAVLLAWPYYSFFALFGVTGLDDINKFVYWSPWAYYGLAAVGLPALWLRLRRHRLDPLVLLFLGAAVLVAAGGVTHRYSLGRSWPAVLLAVQLALAVELPGLPAGTLRRIWYPVTALACAVGLATQGGHLTYALPKAWVPHALVRFDDTWPDYSWVTRYVHPGEVLVTSDYYALRTVPAYGIRTIPPAWPDPFLPDQKLRWHELAVIHDLRVDASVREALLRKYHAHWILEIPGSWAISGGQQPVAVGPAGQRLYRVPGT